MTYRVTDSDLQALLDIVDAGRSDTQAEEGLPLGVLERTSELIGCEILSFLDLDDRHRILYFGRSVPDQINDVPEEAFWNNYWACLPCCYPSVSGDTRTITTISDFYTARHFRDTGMYVEYFAPYGVDKEAMMCLDAPEGRSRRLLFFRERSSTDFDDRDRLLLSLLRPHLNELYQELESRRRPKPDLTARQWELMRLVAAGHSNTEIADSLILSKTTVRKHLENIFARLGVTSRTAAVSRAFPLRPY